MIIAVKNRLAKNHQPVEENKRMKCK